MIRDLAWLIGSVVGLWIVTAIPAYYLGDETALMFAGVAVVLCLTPAVLTLVWAGRAIKGSAEQQLAAALGGMAVRMVVVVVGGMAFFHGVPGFMRGRFWFWVIGFYLVILAVEINLVVARRSVKADKPAG